MSVLGVHLELPSVWCDFGSMETILKSVNLCQYYLGRKHSRTSKELKLQVQAQEITVKLYTIEFKSLSDLTFDVNRRAKIVAKSYAGEI